MRNREILNGKGAPQSGFSLAFVEPRRRETIRAMRQSMGGRMYPLALEGLDKAMRELVR